MIGATIRYVKVNRGWIIRVSPSSAIAFVLAYWISLITTQKLLSLPLLVATGIISTLIITSACFLLLIAWCAFDAHSRLAAVASMSNMTVSDYLKTQHYFDNRDRILFNEIKTGWLQ
jgi:hypothetical protein